MIKIISAFSNIVGNLINLTNNLTQLGPGIEIVFGVHKYPSFHLLPDLNRSKTLLSLNGLGNETPGLNLNIHKLHNIYPLKGTPTMIKFYQILFNLPDNTLKIDINGLLTYLTINIPQ